MKTKTHYYGQPINGCITDSFPGIYGSENTLGSIPYAVFVDKLIKNYPETPEGNDLRLLHAALGIAGEAGELCDAIKRHVIYEKKLDVDNVVEELGDLLFYMQDLMNQLQVSGSVIVAANYYKLRERYKKLEYSNEAAVARADKVMGNSKPNIPEEL